MIILFWWRLVQEYLQSVGLTTRQNFCSLFLRCQCVIFSVTVWTILPLCCRIISPPRNICWQYLLLSLLWSITGATERGAGGGVLFGDCYLEPPPEPYSCSCPVSCRLPNNIMEASIVGILRSTVRGEECVEIGVCVKAGWLEGSYCETRKVVALSQRQAGPRITENSMEC